MADEEQNVADDAAGGASDKSTKKKTVKKATKKSVKKKAVKKKAVKKAAKKSVKKKAVKSTASAVQGSVVTSNNGQKEKAKIRLKDDAAKAEKAQMAASSTIVKPPVKQKKDGLGLLSTLSIALLVIVGIWTVVSYMSSDDGVTTELKTDTATEAAPATVPVAPVPMLAEPAEIVPAQVPMQCP